MAFLSCLRVYLASLSIAFQEKNSKIIFVMNAEKFTEVIEKLRLNQMTVSEYLDRCFDEAIKEGVHPDWFECLRVGIETELKIYADNNIVPENILLSENNVEKTEYGLKVMFRGTSVLDIFFPSEFHENIILRRF